jgi:hypothetical protein
MKKFMMVAASLAALLVLAVAAPAQSGITLRANVPFDFFVGNGVLPAGEYIFEMRPIGAASATATSLAVRSQDGSEEVRIGAMPGFTDIGTSRLSFTRYGDRYFLSRVEALGHQANARVTAAEREYRIATKGKTEVLVAQRLTLGSAY